MRRRAHFQRPASAWLPTSSSTSARVRDLRRRLEVEQDPRIRAMIEAQLRVLDPAAPPRTL